MGIEEKHQAVEAVWRIESARIIAGLAKIVRDIDLAEDLAHDALLAALEKWPETGIPDKPGAWLMTTAKNRALDQFRRRSLHQRKEGAIAYEIDSRADLASEDFLASLEDRNNLLTLMFTACHPILPREARVALTLRLLAGLTTDEIARGLLAPEPTVAQRIVRAKKTLREGKVDFEPPPKSELPARLSSVLEVIYLTFNEGYTATSGESWSRPAFCEEALRLGRSLAELSPGEPEVHGLAALMEIQASRLAARVGPGGEPVLLMDQDRGRWDRLLIHRGLSALERAAKLGRDPGPYVLQAGIAACHARALTPEATDWKRIADLYSLLSAASPSPVVELNRAVAVSMAEGPAAGLALTDPLLAEPSLKGYHLLPAVRGNFLAKLGRLPEAQAEFERAAGLTQNRQEIELLLGRAAACGRGEVPER